MAKKRGRPPKKQVSETHIITPVVEQILEEVGNLQYGRSRSISKLTDLYADYERQGKHKTDKVDQTNSP